MTDMNRGASRERSWLAPLFVAGLIFTTWVAYPVLLELLVGGDPDTRAKIGDMYSGLNTLFSGLALAGVVYAIVLQKTELALQRRELELTREELEKSAEAQTTTASLVRQQLALARSEADSERLRRRKAAAVNFR